MISIAKLYRKSFVTYLLSNNLAGGPGDPENVFVKLAQNENMKNSLINRLVSGIFGPVTTLW